MHNKLIPHARFIKSNIALQYFAVSYKEVKL